MSTLVERMVNLRVNLMKLPARLGVQLRTVIIDGPIPLTIINCPVSKVSQYDVMKLSESLSVGSDDVWAVIPRQYTLTQLNGLDVTNWLIEGVEENPTKYRVAFIDDKQLLTYKVLLNRFYESR